MQVLLKNAKLVPVMVVGRFWLRKRYLKEDYIAVIMLTIGLVVFSFGNAIAKAEFYGIGDKGESP
jgi:hypothetical protein